MGIALVAYPSGVISEYPSGRGGSTNKPDEWMAVNRKRIRITRRKQ